MLVQTAPGTFACRKKDFSLKRDWKWMQTRYDMMDHRLVQEDLDRLINETGYDDLRSAEEVFDAMKNCSEKIYPILTCALRIIAPDTIFT